MPPGRERKYESVEAAKAAKREKDMARLSCRIPLREETFLRWREMLKNASWKILIWRIFYLTGNLL